MKSNTSPIENITQKINNGETLSKEEVLCYVEHHKIAKPDTQNHRVLVKLLEEPDGTCRLCLNSWYEQKYGSGLGQGGTRVIATLRDKGLNIPKAVNNQCSRHGNKPFDKLESPQFRFASYKRTTFNAKERKIIINAFDEEVDAFNGRSEEKLEIDHRIPVARRIASELSTKDISITSETPKEEIKSEFQLLTRQNNLIKDRACVRCVKTDIKPESFGSLVTIDGSGAGEKYVIGENDCSTCPFAFPEKFGLPISIKATEG